MLITYNNNNHNHQIEFSVFLILFESLYFYNNEGAVKVINIAYFLIMTS